MNKLYQLVFRGNSTPVVMQISGEEADTLHDKLHGANSLGSARFLYSVNGNTIDLTQVSFFGTVVMPDQLLGSMR